ncbi:lysozyme g-like [Littorina saxatilis]|uniref:Lysozyme g n=1 Tax=Littorina saxatilis TaxID=31220 RepID=A0AAN9GHU8_9CAEN
MSWVSLVFCLSVGTALCSGFVEGYDVNCYGNINDLNPTGKRIGDHQYSVIASDNEVRHRLSTLKTLQACSEEIAERNCFPASVIGALASRESNGGASLDRRGYGYDGYGYGILQCDVRYSDLPCLDCPPKSCRHITMMVQHKLIHYVQQVARKHPSWSKAQQLQGGVAAYNFGVSNVRSWSQLDIGTAGKDYSNDVIARAQFLRRQGWS